MGRAEGMQELHGRTTNLLASTMFTTAMYCEGYMYVQGDCLNIQTTTLTAYQHILENCRIHTIPYLPTTLKPMVYHSNTYQHSSRRPIAPSTVATTQTITPGANMYYLIHTPHHPRPYLSTVSFIANDFADWGCLVTCHAKNSPYITEIRYQEKRNRPACRRIELMEVWAKEVLARKQQRTPQVHFNEATLPAMRKERASAFVQDFVSGLSVFGMSHEACDSWFIANEHAESPIVAPTALPNDPIPLPAYPHSLVAKYTRLLQRCAYTTRATLPSWADPNILAADQVALEFRFEKSLKRTQLSHALNEAIRNGSGRMGKIERCDETGVTKVLMWVDVGDLEARECGKEEVEDPVPVYDKGEWEWPPSYEECEGWVGRVTSTVMPRRC